MSFRSIFILNIRLVLVGLGIPPTHHHNWRAKGSLEAIPRQVKITKVVSYHLMEVVVPIECLGFYRLTTKKV